MKRFIETVKRFFDVRKWDWLDWTVMGFCTVLLVVMVLNTVMELMGGK